MLDKHIDNQWTLDDKTFDGGVAPGVKHLELGGGGGLPEGSHRCIIYLTVQKVLFDWILPDSSPFYAANHKCSGLILLHVKHKGR